MIESAKNVTGEFGARDHSIVESINSDKTRSSTNDKEHRSWLYRFCLRCKSKDTLPAWTPKYWHNVCPYPYCPTYRQVSRFIGVSLIGALLWCMLYSIVGKSAAPPDGKLFQLILLSVCAHFGGWLVSIVRLPSLIGMLFVGMLFQNVHVVDIDDSFTSISKELRNIALVIILTRAGMTLDANALRRIWRCILQIGLGPWAIEVVLTMVMAVYLLELPWTYGALLGLIIGAVSPAVIVPCLFRLKTEGYGVAKGIPTLIIAIAGIDGAASVAGFGVVKSIIFSSSSVTMLIIQAPLTIVGGIGFGFLWGVMSSFIPERTDPFVDSLRILMLLVGGLMSVYASDLIGFGGSGPLACIAAAFMSLLLWSRQGWEIGRNPAATAFEIFWMVFEPILFGITGASVKFDQLDSNILWICIGILVVGGIIRFVSTIFLAIGCGLNWKEKIFVAVACMAKATVQAALGPAILGLVAIDSIEHEYGKKVSDVCVLSIVVTAPAGAILTTLLGPRLLQKIKTVDHDEPGTKDKQRSRDLGIIEENAEREDIQDGAINEDTHVQMYKL